MTLIIALVWNLEMGTRRVIKRKLGRYSNHILPPSLRKDFSETRETPFHTANRKPTQNAFNLGFSHRHVLSGRFGYLVNLGGDFVDGMGVKDMVTEGGAKIYF